MATAAGFAILAASIRKYWPNYLTARGRLRHEGDETIVSAAISSASEDGLIKVIDADCDGGVARWFTSQTHMPKRTLNQIENRSLLHFPADKDFLASYRKESFLMALALSKLIASMRRVKISGSSRVQCNIQRPWP